MKIIYVLFISILFSGCGLFNNSNNNARNWGGIEVVDLPKGRKFINITWKESNIWYLTRPMYPTDSAEIYEFKEISAHGKFQGTLIIKEYK